MLLQYRIDVCQEEIFAVFIRGGNLGRKRFEHIQFGVERLRLVQIFEVRSRPVEALAVRSLQPLRIHSALGEYGFVLGGEILTHHRNHANVGEVARSEREISGCTTKAVLNLAVRGFNGVERNTSYNENCHVFSGLRVWG